MKKFLLSLIVLCSFAPAVLAQQDTTVVEEIVARVNNSIITRDDLRRNREQQQAGQDPKEQNLPQADRASATRTRCAI